jgi:phage terminase small subunit
MAKWKKKPTPKKQAKASVEQKIALWVEAMLSNGGNATQAAVAAGYKPGSAAEKAGYRMSKNVRVSDILAKRRAEVLVVVEESTGLSVARTLKEVARLAYFDPRKLFDSEGRLIPMTELDDDTAAAVASIEVVEEFESVDGKRVPAGLLKKIKIADKNSALDKAMKHLGLYEADNGQKPEPVVNVGQLTVALDFNRIKTRGKGAPKPA